jgi:hypothetical protein
MRRILLALTIALIYQAADARDFSAMRLAQAQADPDAQAAPATPAASGPTQAPAAEAAPPSEPQAPAALQAIPATGPGQPDTQVSKPVKRRVVRRERSWQAGEARARAIAAKYGIAW